MRYLVAVSGGVDSVVLLDKLARVGGHDLIVAHFDHGIRSDSAADARFVEQLAAAYGFPFVGRREELGVQASEELARTRRYAFLREEAAKRDAVIVTAHHQGDIVETIAINLLRGTGWRGLAVLAAPDIVRPLFSMTKRQIHEYARKRRLEWVEDSTNASDAYLRNRIRRQAARLDEGQREALVGLWRRQRGIKQEIEAEASRLIGEGGEYARYLFVQSDADSAKELLRAAIAAASPTTPTRPQLERTLTAVKTARAGSVFEVGGGIRLRFTVRTFIVIAP